MMNLPSLATSSPELLQLTDSSWIVVQYHIIQNNLADVAILAQAIRLWGFFAKPPFIPVLLGVLLKAPLQKCRQRRSFAASAIGSSSGRLDRDQ